MSTAGKVLGVLVALSIVIAIVVGAGVATVNANGGEALAKLARDVDRLEADLAVAKSDLRKMKSEIVLEQDATTRDLTVIRSRLADVERYRAAIFEDRERSNAQLALASEAVKSAEAGRDQRVKDRADLDKLLSDNKAEVERLMAEESQLRQDRSKLIADLTDTLASNKEMVGRMQASSASR